MSYEPAHEKLGTPFARLEHGESLIVFSLWMGKPRSQVTRTRLGNGWGRALGRRIVVVLALLAGARPSSAQPVATFLPEIERFRLANGLDVVLEKNDRQPRVAIVMAYDVGARDDPPGYAGLAHLVEHLTYRGSKHLASYGGPELLEKAGVGEKNGETSLDRTLYYAVVPAGALELGLWIESERMAFTLESFNENALELERAVVRNELRLRLNVPALFRAHLLEAVYGTTHPYAGITHQREDLEHLGLSAAKWFYQAAYRPDRAHLVIVGNFEPRTVKALIERYFGSVRSPSAAPLVRPKLAAPLSGSRSMRFEARCFEDALVEVRPAPARDAPDHVTAELLARVLHHRLEGALSNSLRYAASVSAELVDSAAGSGLWVDLTPRGGVSPAALEQPLEHTLSAIVEGDQSVALREAKAELRQRELERLERPLERARAHLDAIASGGALFDSAKRLAALEAVTEDDLRALGRTILLRAHVVANLVRTSDPALGPEGTVTFTP